MSGHSKWSQIKRQKGANDAKRGAVFTKMGREISIAARMGGGDPDANYRLRLAIDKARSVNMPADNIKRAIERAVAGSAAEQFEEIVYEGYGPGGVAILVETATNNKNRTASEVRSVFTKNGGSLAGADDVDTESDPIEVVTSPHALEQMRLALEGTGIKVDSAEVTMHAKTPIEVDRHVAEQNLRLIEALEDLEDVQRVTANFDLPAELLAEAAAV